MPPLIVIVGPTASGKSALAMHVAKRFGGEIICADSRTVYKGLDIGTAKPSEQDQQAVRHHLIDVVEPNQPFTVADFKQQAVAAIRDIWARGKWPIMVGGSGLYVDSVLFNFAFGGSANLALREELEQKSVEELQDLCRQKGIKIPQNHLNKRYLMRAIESGGLLQHDRTLRPHTIVAGITTEPAILLENIEQRAAQMVKDGVVNEIAHAGQKYGWDSEAMKGNIYQTFRGVAEGAESLEQGIAKSIQSDKKLVKKQLTWFKRNPYIQWGQPEQLEPLIEHFIQTERPKG